MELCIKCGKHPITHHKTVRLCSSCYEMERISTLPNYGTCIRCKAKPIQHVKRQLCNRCYAYLRRNGGLVDNVMIQGSSLPNDPYEREIDFIKNFFTHSNWQHQPATFKINGARYTPDFYDGERNVFIEISGSRQAYHINKDKYELFKQLFPKLSFEIRKSDGLLLDENNDRLDWS